jgi:hypothetical protein
MLESAQVRGAWWPNVAVRGGVGMSLLMRKAMGTVLDVMVQHYFRCMRKLPALLLVLFAFPALAQESVPALGGASDKGQRVFDRSVGPGGDGASGSTVHSSTAVDRVPAYPGGMDALYKAFEAGCDTSITAVREHCTEAIKYTVRFIVEPDGRTTGPEVLGVESCPVLQVSNACAVGRLKRFSPGILNGVPVRVQMELGFRLDRD